MKKRFFFDRDQSGHWYIIDNSCRDQWFEWANLPEDDERGWDVPEYADRIDHPTHFSFTDPQTGK